MNYDGAIVIAGAGAAGLAAAISASRNGSDTLLIEATSRLGGTVTHSLIHSLGGFYNSDGSLINDGLSAELIERLLKSNARNHKRKIGRLWIHTASPDNFEQLMNTWISEEKRVNMLLNSSVKSVTVEDNKVTHIKLKSSQHIISLRPSAIIDATGSAEIVRMINPDSVTADSNKTAAGLIFMISGVHTDALKFPKNIGLKQKIHKAVKDGMLSSECSLSWIDCGVTKDEAYIKLHIPLSNTRDPEQREKAEQIAKKLRDELLSFLSTLSDFKDAYLSATGSLGIRDGGRIRGEYVLTENDVRELRKFEDAACRCCWPMEYWDRKTGVEVEYLPDRGFYEVPMRSLKMQGIENVWAVGKCLSAEKKAQASARVVGTCWAMGDAVGKTISQIIK